MSFQRIDLTTALRPSLLHGETLLFVQDSVGLYQGKYKISKCQNGHAYLTSHRACYVDNEQPREYSVAIELKDVERYEFYAGFLKSSPKLTFYPKPPKRLNIPIRPSSLISPSRSSNASPFQQPPSPVPPHASNATWICPICSLSNPVPSNFDPGTATADTPMPSCLTCGMQPPLSHMVKAAIRNARNTQPVPLIQVPRQYPIEGDAQAGTVIPVVHAPDSSYPCPRCTFLNHASLLACEMCGAPLTAVGAAHELLSTTNGFRSDSPGPSLDEVNLGAGTGESVKISFRGGGEKTFHERLKGAMIQRKWLLYGAPPIPKPHQSLTPENADNLEAFLGSSKWFSRTPSGRTKNVGVAGLEIRGLELQKSTEVVIGNAFEDLEALKTSAKEIIQLAERFAGHIGSTSLGDSAEVGLLLSQSANAVGLVTTKDMLGSGSNSESLYLSELSRNLAEFLTDDVRDLLRTEGGMMSLVDLWAVFNRSRGGVELVNPLDIEKAVMLWEKLKLPVRFRKFKSGLRAVQSNTWSDDKIVATLLSWLQDRHVEQPPAEVRWDWRQFGRGVTAQEAADRFHWSVAVATEELETAEERGLLCRDEGMEGVRFWENMFLEFSKRA